MAIFGFNKTYKIGNFELNLNIWIILVLIFSAFITFYNIPNFGMSSWDCSQHLATLSLAYMITAELS